MQFDIIFQHTHRTFHDASGKITNQSSGFWFADMDPNSPHSVDRYVHEMKNAQLVTEDCEKYLYCGLPYLVPVLTMIWKTHWLPGPPPVILKPVKVDVKRERIPGGEQLTVTVDGKVISDMYNFMIVFFSQFSKDVL